MVMLYFSGTGNSKYIAELFSRSIEAECHSIEEKIDFGQLITPEEIIGFCYPIYGSRVPRIMREFIQRNMEFFENKKVITLCTQLIFSGDGARVFTDMFPKNFIKVIYAEHFFMPNNVNNFFLLPLTNERKIKKCIIKAEKKMQIVCRNIKNGIIRKRGFNSISRILGLAQGVFMPKIEKKALGSVRINDGCTQCSLCVSICPMNNFECLDGKIVNKRNCTFCYRCINKCPQKAITIFFHEKVKYQYGGV
ncbi:MAG: EFR1 family ferrodoxin [Treponema sp.]|jgi:ferredoxin|nr:EFR1 family ferrodoxin [Treponema sp.]